MIEGFLKTTDEELAEGSASNIFAYRDLFSPFSNVDRITRRRSKDLWLDLNYWLVYSDWDTTDCQLYGASDLLPNVGPLDQWADRGFLRVPFARIPRIAADSVSKIEECIGRVSRAAPEGSRILLRGQCREFQIGRSASALSELYGSPTAIEPSLVPSGSRSGLNVDDIMPAWCGLLQWDMDVAPIFFNRPLTQDDLHSWITNYQFRRFALGMAQHYGLPSNGLDVTDKLGIALFFANYQFELLDTASGTATYRRKEDWSSPSVIYVICMPSSGHSMEFEKSAPITNLVSAIRPTRQSAHFLHRGWGMARNDAARWIVAAIYLEQDIGTKLPSSSELFPVAKADPFAALLEAAKSKPQIFPREINSYLEHYYCITDSSA
jgi:hypothetical protein